MQLTHVYIILYKTTPESRGGPLDQAFGSTLAESPWIMLRFN